MNYSFDMNIMQMKSIDGFGIIILGMNFILKSFVSLMAAKYLLEAVFLLQISFNFTNHLVITNFMQQGPWEANIHSALEDISRNLCNKNFIILFRWAGLVQNKLNLAHNVIACFLMINFIPILLCRDLPSNFFPSGFRVKLYMNSSLSLNCDRFRMPVICSGLWRGLCG
jgi:hypothetical protein